MSDHFPRLDRFPTAAVAERHGRLAAAMRCFDRNDACGVWLPTTDPQGRELTSLSNDELAEVAGWTMLEEFHAAVRSEAMRRLKGFRDRDAIVDSGLGSTLMQVDRARERVL